MARHETELKEISTPDDPAADVVFLHGLGGDWDSTWRCRKTGWSWTEWLAGHHRDLAVWSLDYDVPPLGLGVVSLREHANRALDRCRGLGERPTVFIGHSMGGLLAKAMVVHAPEDDSFRRLAESVRGIVFLGTPHFGSCWATVFGWIGSHALKELRRNARQLHKLHDAFLTSAAGKDLSLRNYKEDRRIGPGKIVADESADPLFEGVICVGLAGNHSDIVKPRGSSSPVVKSVSQFIDELLVEARIRPHVDVKPAPIENVNPFVELRETRNRFTKQFEAKGELPHHIPNRDVDAEVARLLETDKRVLLQGPSKSGKTHTAYTITRRLAERHTLVAPTPGHLSDLWRALQSASEPMVLWLDDLDRFGADSALTVSSLQDFVARGDRLVVATIRTERVEAIRGDRTDTRRDLVRLMDWLPLVRVDGQITDREEADALYPGADFEYGIAGTFVALDEMLKKANRATSGQKAVLQVICDWQRLGFECAGRSVLSDFFPQYGRALSGTVATSEDELDEHLAWARDEIVPDVALVMDRGVEAPCLYLLDGVVDMLGGARAIAPEIVERGIKASPSAAAVGYAAMISSDRTAAEQAWRRGMELGQGAAAHKLGLLFAEEGDAEGAIISLMTARDLAMEQANPHEFIRATIDLADVLQWLGDFKRAKEEIVHAEELIRPLLTEETPTQQDVLTDLLGDISSIMSGKGDPGAAMRTMHLYRASIEVTYYHGLISRFLGEWDEAERCMKEVLPEYRKLRAGEAIEFQLARIELGRERYTEALDQLRRIEHVFDSGLYRPKKGVLQHAQAECLQAMGDSAGALSLIDESISDLTENHFDPDALWRSQWVKARIASEKGDSALGLQSLRASIETIMNLRRSPLGYRLDRTFIEDKVKVFRMAIEVAISIGDNRSCCTYMDAIKSRMLSAVVSIPQARNGEPSGLEGELEHVTAQLMGTEYQGYREGWTPARRRSYQRMLGRRADLLEKIRISDPRWRTLSQPVRLDVRRLQASLSQREQAAITLFLADRTVYALLVTEEEILADKLELSDHTKASLEDYSANLKKSVNVFKHDLSAEPDYGLSAKHLIPAHLLEQALKFRSLVIVPHGRLNLMPWSGLLHREKRLFEYLPVGVLPNLHLLSDLEETPEPEAVGLVGIARYGDSGNLADRPNTRGEIERVVELYGRNRVGQPLLDDDATEANFWALAKRISKKNNILHVSSHGMLVPNEPMNSGLLLYDSKVDAAEIARSECTFNEVVLSGCWTGWQATEVEDITLSSDEILGIPGGFLEARSNSVLVSIPKGNGKTASQLTSHYHQRRLMGESPLFAYRSAQIHMLGRKESKPELWIGFTLYGCH